MNALRKARSCWINSFFSNHKSVAALNVVWNSWKKKKKLPPTQSLFISRIKNEASNYELQLHKMKSIQILLFFFFFIVSDLLNKYLNEELAAASSSSGFFIFFFRFAFVCWLAMEYLHDVTKANVNWINSCKQRCGEKYFMKRTNTTAHLPHSTIRPTMFRANITGFIISHSHTACPLNERSPTNSCGINHPTVRISGYFFSLPLSPSSCLLSHWTAREFHKWRDWFFYFVQELRRAEAIGTMQCQLSFN